MSENLSQDLSDLTLCLNVIIINAYYNHSFNAGVSLLMMVKLYEITKYWLMPAHFTMQRTLICLSIFGGIIEIFFFLNWYWLPTALFAPVKYTTFCKHKLLYYYHFTSSASFIRYSTSWRVWWDNFTESGYFWRVSLTYRRSLRVNNYIFVLLYINIYSFESKNFDQFLQVKLILRILQMMPQIN